jgi:hypothetical protein
METAYRSGLVGMAAELRMQIKYPSLTKEDCAVMLANLDDSLAVFDRKQAVLSASELRVKSLLSALRNEMLQHHGQIAED